MVPTFCRHNRFIERCPICRETLPGQTPTGHHTKPRPKRPAGAGVTRGSGVPRAARASETSSIARRTTEVRVHRESRSEDDGYRCGLVPGLRSSRDAQRLVNEIGFSSGRLLALTAAPPGLYAEARDCPDIEQSTWTCFLIAYLSPLQGPDPFAGIRQALPASWSSGEIPDLIGVPLGPRTSHDPSRGSQTIVAYRRFAEHAGSQELAFTGEPSWTPERRFERVFERLAIPGLGRMGRYDLLVTLGGLGLYDLEGGSLFLDRHSPRSASAAGDPTLLAAKRVFGIGDGLYLERRLKALAQALSVPIEALDLALANWGSEERATLGFPSETTDVRALERAHTALEL